MFLLLIATLLAILAAYIYLSFRRSYTLWHDLGIPYLKPTFPFGNISETLKKKHFGFVSQSLYNQLKHHEEGYAGLFLFKTPILIVLSPEFAKTVLVKDFQYFTDRGMYNNKRVDPLSANLFFIEGTDWRHLRLKLTPTFTSNKIKTMFEATKCVADELVAHLSPTAETGNVNVEIKEFLARFTTDVIGNVAFGIKCCSISDPDSEFRRMGKRMFYFSKLKSFKLFLAMIFREEARALKFRMNDLEVTDFVMDLVRRTIRHRLDNGVVKNDFMQLMIDMYDGNGNKEKSGETTLSLEEIAAQAFLFFFAGFETSATTMTFALYELAVNQDIQDRLRGDICESYEQNGNNFTYESVMGMKYLDMVINGE